MGLVVTYFSPTTPGSASWSEDLSDYVRLGSIAGLIDAAELGTVGVSSLIFDDVDGTLGHAGDAIVGLKQMEVNETAAPSGDQRLWTGYIGDRRYRRGTGDSLRTGVARKIDTTLVDVNSFLSFRIFAPKAMDPTSSFVRLAETDVQRVAGLLTDVDFLSTTLFDLGYVESGTGVAMDAVDYTGQHPADVLNDCAQASGRNFFVYYDESANKLGLFYHKAEDPVYDSALQISNVLTDVDNVTTFAPEPDAELVRDPSRVVSAVYLPFNGSNVAYRTRPATAYTYAWRDATAPSANVKTLAKANARADRYLLNNDTEDDRITCTIKIPREYVTGIKAGQRIKAKFSHLPNGSNSVWGPDFAWCRILQRDVMANELTNTLYNMRLELSPGAVGSFAQLVLVSSLNGGAGQTPGTVVPQDGSPYDFLWNAVPFGSAPARLPSVVQDTAGFTGTIGDMQWAAGTMTSVTVPAGHGGTYSMGLEQFNQDASWWDYGGSAPIVPTTPYVPSLTVTSPGEIVGTPPDDVYYDIRVNGTPVASSSWHGSGGGYEVVNCLVRATGIVLADGDVITTTIMTPNCYSVWNALGCQLPAQVCGVFYLTWTGP